MVLALEVEWEHLELSTRSCLEIAAHIFSSGWIWRLWTLQEGTLPEQLWFQFGDRPIEAHSLYLALRDILRGLDTRNAVAATELLGYFQSLRILNGQYQFTSSQQKVQMLALAMEKRVTTHRRDEAFCIATLLGHDTGPILEDQDPERSSGCRKCGTFSHVKTAFEDKLLSTFFDLLRGRVLLGLQQRSCKMLT